MENAEQTTTTEQQTNGAADVTREDLIAAAREAGGTDSVDVAAEAKEAEAKIATDKGSAAKEGEAAKVEAVDPDEPKVAALLRAREKAWQERQEADSYATQRKAQADQEAALVIEQAREKARAEHQQYVEDQRRKFGANPTETLRALAPGGDTQKLVDAVIRDGSPEGRAIADLQREVAEAKKSGEGTADLRKQIEDMKAEREREKHDALVAQIRTEFISQNATKEKTPYLHARYDEEEIFDKANKLGLDWQQKGLKLGHDFTRDDIAEWLERDSKKRYVSSVAPQQAVGAAPSEGAGKRPQGLANGSRTLSAASGSERRTSPKPLSEMSAAEARQALIDEVATVRRTLKDPQP